MVFIWLAAGFFALACVVLAALLVFGTAAVGPPREGLGFNTGLENLDYSDLPETQVCPARDGRQIPYRLYPAEAEKTVILIHGSASRGRSLHGLAEYLAEAEIARCVTLDMRGHGWGRPGDLDYVGQLEHDLADLIEHLARQGLAKRLVVLGFSMGGGFALRFAGSRYGEEAGAYVFLAPFIGAESPTLHPDNGWAYPQPGRILALRLLNALRITWFNRLTALRFAIGAEDLPVTTPDYSYRMMLGFAPRADYRANLKRITRPGVVIIGSEDQDFRPEAYPEDVIAHARNLRFTLLEGLNHMDLITDDRAFRAIGEEIERL
ncbi:MAG: alpha/beta hydrolase [Kiloniellales bacterium]|nr:alpha/beta hydrolase [Kiloniellales bacterium]